jgi:hypothetical protein
MNSCKIIALAFVVLLQSTACNVEAQSVKMISISNPLDQYRADELIVLKRKEIEKKLGVIPEGKYLSLTTKDDTKVVVQQDDLDGNGKWEEAAFLYSFGPKEKVVFKLAVANVNSNANAVAKAHVRLKKKTSNETFGPSITKEEMPLKNPATDFSKQPLPLYLTEGPGWENDKVAFRLYFDVRNGKDIFAKRTARMVLDSVGVKVHPSYHELQDWGMDVLHAGKSLGSGALALLVLKDGKDTLMRLGGENIKRTVYQQIADGPIRGLFRISYEWQIEGKPVHIEEQTSIWGGQYFYESSVRVIGAPDGSKLICGIASFYDNVFQNFSTNSTQVFLSHGRQSEHKDYLGMAIVVPQKDFEFAGSTPNAGSDILNTYIVAQNIQPGKPCNFRFYAGWERSDTQFASINFLKDFLKKETKEMAAPLRVVWIN